jgi:hypothetical protein
LLPVPIGEHRAFFGDAIDVRRTVAHDSVVVSTDIEPADVISPDDQYVWFVSHAVPFSLENSSSTSKTATIERIPLLATCEKIASSGTNLRKCFSAGDSFLGAPAHFELLTGKRTILFPACRALNSATNPKIVLTENRSGKLFSVLHYA